jgi:hypothetical protein
MTRKQMIAEALTFYYLSYEAVSEENGLMKNKFLLEDMETHAGICKVFRILFDKSANEVFGTRWIGFKWSPPTWANSTKEIRQALRHRISFLEKKLNQCNQ